MRREAVGRAIAKREGEAVQAHPADDESGERCDEAGAAQERCDAIDGALMVCGVRAVLGVEAGNELDGLLNMKSTVKNAAFGGRGGSVSVKRCVGRGWERRGRRRGSP